MAYGKYSGRVELTDMRFFGAESKRMSPYMDELVRAQCVQRLANFIGLVQMPSGSDDSRKIDFDESPALLRMMADVESVREEYVVSPYDIQAAPQANDAQLIVGARMVFTTKHEGQNQEDRIDE